MRHQDELLQLFGLDEDGRIALQVWFDVEDMDAAIAELDAVHARFEEERPPARRLENAASRVFEANRSHFAARDWDAMAEIVADNYSSDRSPTGRECRESNMAEMPWSKICKRPPTSASR